MGQLEPSARKGVVKACRIGDELLADRAIGGVHLHRHVGIGHHRHGLDRGILDIGGHVFGVDVHGLPLIGAGGRFPQLPFMSEQHVEIAHVPLGGVGRPRALDAADHLVATDAAAAFLGVPAQALLMQRRTFRLRAHVLSPAVAVAFADGVTARGQRDGFLIVHGHPGEGLADVLGGGHRIGLAVHAFGVHIDQTHLHGCQRVFHRLGLCHVRIAAFRPFQELLLGAPVDVLFGVPDVLAAKGETERLQTRLLIGDGPGQYDQVGPADLVAVFLLDRPQQTAALVGVVVVGPAVQRRKALVAGARTTTPVAKTVRSGGVPGDAREHADIAAPVRGPPLLAVGHQGADVVLQRLDVQRLQRLAIVEVGAKRVRLAVMLVQDVEVQRTGPPIGVRRRGRGMAAMHHRAFAGAVHRVAVHHHLHLAGHASRSGGKPRTGRIAGDSSWQDSSLFNASGKFCLSDRGR